MKTEDLKMLQNTELKLPNLTMGIFLISLLILFLELLFIRWIGTEIRVFAYLQNTILVVCFLGLGIGMFTPNRPIDLKHTLIPLGVLVLLLAIPQTRQGLGFTSEMLSTFNDFVIWGAIRVENTFYRALFMIIGLVLMFVIMILIVDIFVPLGRILGRLMNAHPRPIWAYSVNILGSILGSWLFVLLSFFYQPPVTWFLILSALLAWFVYYLKRDQALLFVLLILLPVGGWFAGQVPNAQAVIWSPYQKLVLEQRDGLEGGDYLITVNNTPYQGIINLSRERVAARPDLFPAEYQGLSQYDLPLLFHPEPKSFLIVGAGSGNDAAGGIRAGVPHIVAVEIDPAIVEMGINLHPEQPYLAPGVDVVVDDARSYFSTTNEKYDVISFGLLDSHTTTSMTNARLDHYVYTRESVLQAKSLLNENGVMVLTFEATPFITDRFYNMLQDIFGMPPIVFRIPTSAYGWGGVMFVTGDMSVVESQVASNPRLGQFIEKLQEQNPIGVSGTIRQTTDDWPYIYLRDASIPVLYYILTILIVLIYVRSTRKWDAHINFSYKNREFWHFFFLGAAFLLLEVQNISKASIVLGNTWNVNAIIISGILFMALLANWLAYRFPNIPIRPVYFLLIGVSIILYFVDLAWFGALPYALKSLVVGIVTSLPMLFSGIIFIRSFMQAREKSRALGANFVGALVGALLQSVTFITGIRALLFIVAVFYFISFLTAPKEGQE